VHTIYSIRETKEWNFSKVWMWVVGSYYVFKLHFSTFDCHLPKLPPPPQICSSERITMPSNTLGTLYNTRCIISSLNDQYWRRYWLIGLRTHQWTMKVDQIMEVSQWKLGYSIDGCVVVYFWEVYMLRCFKCNKKNSIPLPFSESASLSQFFLMLTSPEEIMLKIKPLDREPMTLSQSS